MDRRTVLRGGTVALAGIAIPSLAKASVGARVLAFDNLHTGEKLRTTYWESGQYVPEALTTINHLLRDFRTGDVHFIEPRLLDLLARLHESMESGSPFQVISGYRSPKTNAMLHAEGHGVATQSLHMSGMAIDIRLVDRGLDQIHGVALAMRAGGVGFYPTSNFVHLDVGRIRHWQERN